MTDVQEEAPRSHKKNSTIRVTRRQGIEVKLTKRKCICCRADFMSEGIHNRLCLKCRHIDYGMDDFGR